MQNLRKTNETGRSMVEMLGVLAIIGVLSVAGVGGYKAAVRKALANNLLNQASMRATDVATKIGSGNLDALDSDSFAGNLGGGVTMSSAVKGPDGYADYDESDEQFTLTMEGVDEELCQQMQSMAGGSRSVVREVECVNNADGDLVAILTFNKDLSANDKTAASDFVTQTDCELAGKTWCSDKNTTGGCSDSADCCEGVKLNSCQKICDSSTGKIVSKNEGALCDYTTNGSDGVCKNGECVSNLICPIGSIFYSGACVEKCSDDTCINGTCSQQSGICTCPAGYFFDEFNVSCRSCSSGNSYFSTEEAAKECAQKCTNEGQSRYSYFSSTVKKYLCVKGTPKCPTSVYSTVDGLTKEECESCSLASVYSDGVCIPCGYSLDGRNLANITMETSDEAEYCAQRCTTAGINRYAHGNVCSASSEPPATCPTSISAKVTNFTSQSCDSCEIPSCVASQYVMTNLYRYCIACGAGGMIHDSVSEAQACVEKCTNAGYPRIQNGKYSSLIGTKTCPKSGRSVSDLTEEECNACSDPVTSFDKVTGTCYACDYNNRITGADDCAQRCSDAGFPRYDLNGICLLGSLEACPASGEFSKMTEEDCESCGNASCFEDRLLRCYDCNYSSYLSYESLENAQKCARRCTEAGIPRYVNYLNSQFGFYTVEKGSL